MCEICADWVRSLRMDEPTRAEVDAFTEPTVLEFGTSWCGYCQAAQADIASVMKNHPTVRHIKVEDGRGRPLGRSFRVKLWPTLIYLEKGVEKGRVVRPEDAAAIETIFKAAGPTG
jgi:thioredoxin 1